MKKHYSAPQTKLIESQLEGYLLGETRYDPGTGEEIPIVIDDGDGDDDYDILSKGNLWDLEEQSK